MSGEVVTRLAELERELATLGADELPRLLGELERLRAAMWARLVGLSANGQSRTGHDQSDELLGVKEAARRLGSSPDYLYRSKDLPFRVRIGRRVRFSAKGIECYIRQRQGR